MKRYLFAAIMLAGASVAVVAQDSGAAGNQAEGDSEGRTNADMTALAAAVNQSAALEEEDPADQEVQCRTERITGSLTRRRRTCMTVGEWRELEAATYHGVSNMNRNASGGRECRGDQFGGC